MFLLFNVYLILLRRNKKNRGQNFIKNNKNVRSYAVSKLAPPYFLCTQ